MIWISRIVHGDSRSLILHKIIPTTTISSGKRRFFFFENKLDGEVIVLNCNPTLHDKCKLALK